MEFTGERMIPEYNDGQGIHLEHMARYMFASQFVEGKVVLDIACGSGYGSDYLLEKGRACQVFGVDIAEEAIAYSKERYQNPDLKFLSGSVEKIPLEDRSIDVVVSFETIEHVSADAQLRFLSEIKRVLRLDGKLVISTPNSDIYPKGNKFHIKELSPSEFDSLLGKNFKTVKTLYQGDIECSYIYSKENSADDFSEVLKKTDRMPTEKGMYLVAVCSDGNLGDVAEYLIMSKITIFEMYSYFLSLINEKEMLMNRKDDEIRFMQESRFWKMRNLYMNTKKRLKELI